jgi:hypothetical protein
MILQTGSFLVTALSDMQLDNAKWRRGKLEALNELLFRYYTSISGQPSDIVASQFTSIGSFSNNRSPNVPGMMLSVHSLLASIHDVVELSQC